MADEKILPAGVRFFNKNNNAPDFVIGTAVISINELVQFCKDKPELLTEYNGAKQLKLQVLKSKDGKLYSVVDTWKPTTQASVAKDYSKDLPF